MNCCINLPVSSFIRRKFVSLQDVAQFYKIITEIMLIEASCPGQTSSLGFPNRYIWMSNHKTVNPVLCSQTLIFPFNGNFSLFRFSIIECK